ncbi:hypothetical protein [Longispora albida]|uniref:hypothetical protein n=1 Tax=Longispora albida TaxID=203523 RepID=UPI0012FA38D6|nr:hypothetical protein [Longispora albida]
MERLLADPEFRAAKQGARQRIAKLAVPEEVSRWAGWEVTSQACERAEHLAARADGFAPPAGVRDELYAQAQRVTRNPQRTSLL